MADSTTETVTKKPSWWRDRSALERGLAVLVGATLLAAIAFVVSLGVLRARWQHQHESVTQGNVSAMAAPPPPPGAHEGNRSQDGVCITPGCIHAASLVLSKFDTSVAPCDDFYQYACGTYVRSINIPDDKSSVDTISTLKDELLEKLRNAIEEENPQAVIPRSLRLARDFYRACMNKSLIESRGMRPLQDVLKGLGGWPAVEGASWDETGFDWLQSIYRFHRAGYSEDYFFTLSVATDSRNSSRRTISLDPTKLGMDTTSLLAGLSDKRVNAYLEFQVDLAVMLGADRNRAKRELRKSVKFEISLARIMVPERTVRYTVEQLESKYGSVPWVQYLRTLLPSHLSITNSEEVVVKVPNYLKMLELLLKPASKREVANYVMWRAAETSVRYLTEDVRERQLQYNFALTGKKEWQPRSRECVQNVVVGLPLSAGSIYVRRYFDEDAKKAALEMVADIRQAFLQTLQEVDWMDERTRMKALEKANSMVAHIAYPDELVDDNKLDEFYEKLEINPTMYLESLLNVTKFLTDKTFSKLRQPINKTDWITHGEPATVNAYYNTFENSIMFPAGILQGAFFSADRPKYMNYGGIGSTIGHEITHGFDDKGRKYDKEGNLLDWWDPVTSDKFLKKADCIITQYGNFTDKQTKMNLNGKNTQGENIADNGGAKEAYRAYLALEGRTGQPEPRLPSLEHLSPRQMFWVSVAQTWCTKYRRTFLEQDIKTNHHPPSRFRILGPLSNRPEFAKDFECPIGSPMNPMKKCQVW